MMKKFVQKRLERAVKKYFKKHPEVKLVVVTGSVGKTSTKRALATLLSQRYRVQMENNNHNTEMSAPLGILGIEYPIDTVRSVGAWMAVFKAARKRIKDPTGVDVIIQELGSEHPGEIAEFAKYLKPDIAVITGVTPEHMEFFGTLEAVAQEELLAANFSQLAVINRDDIAGEYATYVTNTNLTTYGSSSAAEYRFEETNFSLEDGYSGQIIAPELAEPLAVTEIHVVGEHSLRPIMGAVAVSLKLGVSPEDIQKGLQAIRPMPGRMNPLKGIDSTIVIDDSYNSSPAAASAALQALYALQVPQRIALIGSMNELGMSSPDEHRKLGELCDPGLLSWVVTVGDEAEKHLAPAARARGCQVKSFKSAIDAGAFVRSVTEPGAVILVKGSQGNIYTEEAVKVLCLMSEDVELVRQEPHWIKIKDEFFSKFQ
jgi:UDP-N-acetylmuramoyl-tripeptide--D-alanyl-D-alanine ligase